MNVHVLKTHPGPFADLLRGTKRYEIRVDDRGFAVGDCLWLKEWDPALHRFTGREYAAPVIHLTPGGYWGLPPNLCVLGLGDPIIREEFPRLYTGTLPIT